jgi:DNA-binding transcriptional LysR family regulator
MVNLEWYRTFKAIYQNGTLTKAAQELLISQPNVSIQLSSLETYMGHILFTRLPRKMVPTELGKQLYTQIVESIDNLERVEAQFKKSTINKTPSIRLGTPPEIFYSYLAPNIESLPLQLEVKFDLAGVLTESLINDELDIAIITQKSNNPDDSITYESFLSEKFMIVCNPEFDTSEFDNYVNSGDLEHIEKWLKKQKWLAYSNNLALIRRFWRENFKKRPLLKLQAVIPDNNSILATVSNSNILAVSSSLIAGKAIENKSVKILWEGINPATNMLYLAYNKSKVQPDYIKQVKNFLNLSLNLPTE